MSLLDRLDLPEVGLVDLLHLRVQPLERPQPPPHSGRQQRPRRHRGGGPRGRGQRQVLARPHGRRGLRGLVVGGLVLPVAVGGRLKGLYSKIE